MALTPTLELFHAFNDKNNVNPLSTPALFTLMGSCARRRDPRKPQLSVRFDF